MTKKIEKHDEELNEQELEGVSGGAFERVRADIQEMEIVERAPLVVPGSSPFPKIGSAIPKINRRGRL